MMARFGGTKEKKGPTTVYQFTKPSDKFVTEVLPPLHDKNCPYLPGTATPESLIWLKKIYICVELFLRTQTYDAKVEGYNQIDKSRIYIPQNKQGKRAHFFTTTVEDRAAYANAKKIKRWVSRPSGDGGMEEYAVSEGAPNDPIPFSDEGMMGVAVDESVHVARPSKEDISYNLGASTDLPYKSGVFLPYFQGMFSNDAQDFRTTASELFFRLLQGDGLTMQESWKCFREEITGAIGTPEAEALHHIMKCLSLCVDGQARPYVIMNDGVYKGTCILGSFFTIYVANTAYRPLEPAELKEEVQTLLVTRKESLVSLLANLKLCKDAADEYLVYDPSGENPESGDEMDLGKVKDADIKVHEIIDMMSHVDEEKSGKDLVARISSLVPACFHVREYQRINVENVCQALEDIKDLLSGETHDVWDANLPCYVPRTGWKVMSNPYYGILSRFGPNSFSFIDPKGSKIAIPAEVSKDAEHPMFKPAEKGDKVRFLVYEKSIGLALQDFAKMLETGCISMNLKERAGSSRAFTFIEKGRVKVVDILTAYNRASLFKEETAKKVGVAGFGSSLGKRKEIDTSKEFDIDAFGL
jgi:hypothetical protein